MPANSQKNLVAILLLLASTAQGAVYRCVDASGRVDLRDSPCSSQQQGSMLPISSVNILPAPTASDDAPMPRKIRPTGRRERSGRQSTAQTGNNGSGGILVLETGQRSEACMDSLDERSRRRAIIEQRIYPGMSQAAVERALGLPEQRSRSGSKLRYHYPARTGHKPQTITFDEDGCVAGKSSKSSH